MEAKPLLTFLFRISGVDGTGTIPKFQKMVDFRVKRNMKLLKKFLLQWLRQAFPEALSEIQDVI